MALPATPHVLNQTVRNWTTAAIDLLWPPQCPCCGGAASGHRLLCPSCATRLPRITGPRCEVCSQPFPGGKGDEFVCSNCRDRQFHFVCTLSPLLAKGGIREMIHRLKYNRERWLAPILAEWMAEVSEDERIDISSIDCLVPVPLHPARKREREFNQAELLAIPLGKIWKKPVELILERTQFTETQTHFDRHERMRNLRKVFSLRKGASVEGRRILLVDDVFTTGSTLDECARTLLEAKAAAVWAVTAARA